MSHAHGFDGGHGCDFGGGHGHGHGHGHEGTGGGAPCSGFAMGSVGHALSCMGLTEGCEDGGNDAGRRVKISGSVHNDRSYQVLVFPHGCDDPNKLIRDLLAKHGFRNICHQKRMAAPVTKQDATIKDTTPFDGQAGNSPMPSGWFPGATGFTRWHQHFWQLPTDATFWHEPHIDLKEPIHLLVNTYTWFYDAVGDFETRVLLGITGKTAAVQDLVARYMARMGPLAADILNTVGQFKPPVHSVMQRTSQQNAAALLEQTAALLDAAAPYPVAPPMVSGRRRTIGSSGVAGGDAMAFDQV